MEQYHLNESLKQFEPNETHCFYCGSNGAGQSSNYFIPVYKERDRTNLIVYRSVKYGKLKIGIPRCESCANIHHNAGTVGTMIALAAAILTMVVGILIWGIFGIFAFIPAIIIGFLLYGYIVKKNVRGKGIATADDGARQDPLVQQFLLEGWTLTQPSA